MDWPKQPNRVRPSVVSRVRRVEAQIEDTEEWIDIDDVGLDERDSLRTGDSSSVELQFGELGPVARFGPNTRANMHELGFEYRGDEQILHIVIDLEEGSILSDLTGVPPGTTFFVRTLHWVLQAQGGAFEARADGTVDVAAGQVIVDNPDKFAELKAGESYQP